MQLRKIVMDLTICSMVDKHSFEAVAQGGFAQARLGRLAADKDGTDAVKDFGIREVKDHSALNDAMKPSVEQAGLTVSSQLCVKQRSLRPA